MSLYRYSPRQHAIYLSRNHHRILWHDSISALMFHEAVLEIIGEIKSDELRRGNPPKIGTDIIKERIADLIDIVKWALATALGQTASLIEGTITYDDLLGGPIDTTGFGAFRREEKNSGTSYKLSPETFVLTKTLISEALTYRDRSPDLRQAFWHWGRGCLANIDRDRLLDSVIGLERLLVQYPGESRYRFGLHGAALLAKLPEEAESKAQELRSAYNKRSSAAHGKREDRIREGYLAHNALGAAIKSLLELFESGLLKPESRIAEQIERLILRNASIGPYYRETVTNLHMQQNSAKVLSVLSFNLEFYTKSRSNPH